MIEEIEFSTGDLYMRKFEWYRYNFSKLNWEEQVRTHQIWMRLT